MSLLFITGTSCELLGGSEEKRLWNFSVSYFSVAEFFFNVSFKINKGRCVVGQKKKGEHSQGIFRGKC